MDGWVIGKVLDGGSGGGVPVRVRGARGYSYRVPRGWGVVDKSGSIHPSAEQAASRVFVVDTTPRRTRCVGLRHAYRHAHTYIHTRA